MMFVTRIARTVALLLVLFGTGSSPALAQPAPAAEAPATTAAQAEYVPIDQLPEGETLPAAPFLIAADAVAWGAILVYLLMLWRRLARVEADLRDARRAAGGR